MGNDVDVEVGEASRVAVGGIWVIAIVGAGLGGMVVGSAAAVWAAWVNTSPGSGVETSVVGWLQATRASEKRTNKEIVRSVCNFIIFTLMIKGTGLT